MAVSGPETKMNSLNSVDGTKRLQELLSMLPKLKIPKVPAKFELPQKLPFELRILIWNFASFHPQTIALRLGYDFVAAKGIIIKNTNTVPAILHVCSEARKEALKRYETITNWPVWDSRSTSSFREALQEDPHMWMERQREIASNGGRKLYVNFLVDRFLHGPPEEGWESFISGCHNFKPDVLKKIRFLDFEMSAFASPNNHRTTSVSTDLDEVSLIWRVRDSGNGRLDLFGANLIRTRDNRASWVLQLLILLNRNILHRNLIREDRKLEEEIGGVGGYF
jgi:hypothetical protein